MQFGKADDDALSLATPFFNRHSNLFHSADKISEEANENYLFSASPFDDSGSDIDEIIKSEIGDNNDLDAESENFLNKLT